MPVWPIGLAGGLLVLVANCARHYHVMKRTNAPLDPHLNILGGFFFHQIWHKKWVEALDTFEQIEARTTLLLNELYNKKNTTAPIALIEDKMYCGKSNLEPTR